MLMAMVDGDLSNGQRSQDVLGADSDRTARHLVVY